MSERDPGSIEERIRRREAGNTKRRAEEAAHTLGTAFKNRHVDIVIHTDEPPGSNIRVVPKTPVEGKRQQYELRLKPYDLICILREAIADANEQSDGDDAVKTFIEKVNKMEAQLEELHEVVQEMKQQ